MVIDLNSRREGLFIIHSFQIIGIISSIFFQLLMILFMALVWPIYLFPKELERFRFEEIFDQRDRINNDYERALQRRRQYLAEQEAKDGQPTI